MKLQGDTTSMRVEPFAVVIRCTSAPDKVDGKTRSKWSRALHILSRLPHSFSSARVASTNVLYDLPVASVEALSVGR